jgi:2-oxoglutarate ferredoxin oxidoreductase subunit alpha
MAKVLMKGNHAIAEAAIRAGCRFFAGYPITPQSEIVEYMSWRMPEAGGRFVQTESELAGISMVYGAAACGARALTSSSGPGFSLLQEGISYLSSAELPAVIIDVMRYGNGLGDITPAQSDYLQAVKRGGHGDYRCIVLAPSSIQDAVDLMRTAYDLAEKYRNPVIFLCDGATAQMVEAVEFPEMKTVDPYSFDWALQGDGRGKNSKLHTSKCYYDYVGKAYDDHIRDRFGAMEKEVRWEDFQTADADYVLVAYGVISRVCKEAALRARAEGLKLGLIRPIALWPFPSQAFAGASPKAFISVEMSVLPQMAEDVALAARGRAPVHSLNTGQFIPEYAQIRQFIENVKNNQVKEV